MKRKKENCKHGGAGLAGVPREEKNGQGVDEDHD